MTTDSAPPTRPPRPAFAVLERVRESARPARWFRHREPPGTTATPLGRGVILRGLVWPGGQQAPFAGIVAINGSGRITYLGPRNRHIEESGLRLFDHPTGWIGPGVCDAHVHLPADPATAAALFRGGVTTVRDLGSSRSHAARIRTRRPGRGDTPTARVVRPFVATAGPMFTAPGGFPDHSEVAGSAEFVHSIGHARQLVRRRAAEGADVVKVALDRGGLALDVLSPGLLRAIVDAAHDAGLPVIAHALRVDLVSRAVDAGVDELAHVPTERLSEELVDEIAAAGISVVSTLQSFFSAGKGRAAAANAAALVRGGVTLRYGTDFGIAAAPCLGVDPRELDRLADAGLGRFGALRAATEHSAAAPGLRDRRGVLAVGALANAVMLGGDPVVEPGAWRFPLAVVADGSLIEN